MKKEKHCSIFWEQAVLKTVISVFSTACSQKNTAVFL